MMSAGDKPDLSINCPQCGKPVCVSEDQAWFVIRAAIAASLGKLRAEMQPEVDAALEPFRAEFASCGFLDTPPRCSVDAGD